jgi:hypothetical protein
MTTVSSNENLVRHDDNETNDKQKLTPILLSLNSNYSNIVDGIFLLLLAISGNFLAETMGCSIQKLLSTNQYAKHFMIFCIIYFTIDYSDTENPNPSGKLYKSLIVYVFYLLSSKVHLNVAITIFFALVIFYILNSYKKYFIDIMDNDDDDDDSQNASLNRYIYNIDNFQKILLIFVSIITPLGFLLYFNEKKIEYADTFNYAKFIFGAVKCKSLK